MGLKVVVDFDLCEANARCMEVCPEVFKVDDDDFLHVLIEEGPQLAPLREKLKEAERVCPRQAITIVES
jgi:ferredoxin